MLSAARVQHATEPSAAALAAAAAAAQAHDDRDDDDGAHSTRSDASAATSSFISSALGGADHSESSGTAMSSLSLCEPRVPREQRIRVFARPGSLSSRAVGYVEELCAYFSVHVLRRCVAPIVKEKAQISLRDLSWAVTNFMPAHRVTYRVPCEPFAVDIAASYNTHLDGYEKSNFDMFRRGPHILVTAADDAAATDGDDGDGEAWSFDTTVGQLMFFRWALDYRVLDWVAAHHAQLRQHMNEAMQRRRRERQAAGGKARRRELTKKAPLMCHSVPQRVEIHYT